MIYETRIAFVAENVEQAKELTKLMARMGEVSTVQRRMAWNPGDPLPEGGLVLGVREITDETPGLEAEQARRHFENDSAQHT